MRFRNHSRGLILRRAVTGWRQEEERRGRQGGRRDESETRRKTMGGPAVASAQISSEADDSTRDPLFNLPPSSPPLSRDLLGYPGVKGAKGGGERGDAPLRRERFLLFAGCWTTTMPMMTTNTK